MKIKFDERTIVFMLGNGIWIYLLSKTHWLFLMVYAMLLGYVLDQTFKKKE